MAKQLVIVESPSKAKTIGKYLGSDYVVKASMGHLRDLPKSKMGVDFEHDFQPQYEPMAGKEDVIRDLQSAAKKADHVFLATDPDREGEAISWHLKEMLKLSDEKASRVTFNEITNRVVNESIRAPRAIDFNLVDAQQARRILDRIVGYQLSPLLWKKIRRGLSAGRVQSVATRLVVDRENEIRAFEAQEYWTVEAGFRRIGKPGSFVAHYHGEDKKRELHSYEEVQELLRDLEGKPFVVTSVKNSEKRKQPTPPFITSTLQQEASRKLNMTPRRTMTIAQQLYEGVDISGEGTIGLITYMRTDSLRLSDEALNAAKDVITGRYGKNYYQRRTFKTSASAQDAHEAIRPSNVQLVPESVRSDLTADQYKLYKLIWDRFTASQMAPAVYDTTAIDVTCSGHIFRANHQSLRFAGFTAVYEEGKDDEQEEKDTPLPDLQENEPVELTKTVPEQHFTQPPPRYTEATLVRAMEEKGVGRPSTYASIVSTIEDREYVEKKDKRLMPTKLGETVNTLMMERFQDIVDVDFTAHMEQELDRVEEGKLPWKDVIRGFYTSFTEELKSAETALEGIRIKVPEEVTDEICELCGKPMVIKTGRFGKFLGCSGFPECKNTKPIVVRMPGRCPKCGSGLLKRTSKKGYAYYACEQGQACGFMTWDVPTEQDCPVCGQTMFKRSGRGAMKPFCVNPECSNFLPEDKRGYRRKTNQEDGSAAPDSGAEQGTAEKKAAASKTGTRKTTAKKPAARKTAASNSGRKTAKKETQS